MKLKYPQEEIDFVQKLPRAFDFIYPYIYLHDKSVRLINGNNRYVLSISEELTVDTAFIINYGKYDVIHDNSTTKYTPNSPYLWKKFDVYESNNYLFMIFHTGSLGSKTAKMISLNGSEYIYPFSCSIFNKNTGEFTFLDQPEINQLGFVDDIEGGPAIWPKYVSSDNYLISFIPAEEFIAHAEKHKVSANYKEIAAKLQEADNPVLVKVKLK